MLGDPSWGARCGVGTWVVGSGVGWKPPAWKSRCVVESLSMGARGGHVSSSSSCLRDPPPAAQFWGPQAQGPRLGLGRGRLTCTSGRASAPAWPPAALRGGGTLSTAACPSAPRSPVIIFGVGTPGPTSCQHRDAVGRAEGVLGGGAGGRLGWWLAGQQPAVAVPVDEALAAHLRCQHPVQVVGGSLGTRRGSSTSPGGHQPLPEPPRCVKPHQQSLSTRCPLPAPI